MRLWSLHPSYLDSKGIVALWREALLAKHVLEGKTKGYTNHPQLVRFRNAKDPLSAINSFLLEVQIESEKRGYKFNKTKIGKIKIHQQLPVTEGQLEYEFEHLKKKLFVRDANRFKKINNIKTPKPHPLFRIVNGEVEEWEKV
jgi:hypothetical protein